MERWSVIVEDEGETAALAAALAPLLRAGDTVLLEGTLGAGKTTFARALARALGVPEEEPITSPTFALVHEYECEPPLLHADLYRLSDADELLELGLGDTLGVSALTLVEWGERFSNALPGKLLLIRMEPLDGDRRRIAIEAAGSRGAQVLSAVVAARAPL